MGSDVEKKLDLVLKKLEHIEKLLAIGEGLPERDELKAIEGYLKQKRAGDLELVPVKAVFNEV